jgi:hypothetical protein
MGMRRRAATPREAYYGGGTGDPRAPAIRGGLAPFISNAAEVHWAMRIAVALLVAAVWASPALAQDLNSFRAQHGKPALSYSSRLAAMAHEQAFSMANRGKLDHANFKQRAAHLGTTAAENVSYGCDSQDCAIRQWARSAGHRRNMLRGDVSAYGIASAVGQNGKRYWALELGGE